MSPLHERIACAASDSARGCGLSDDLFESRLQAMYRAILAKAPEAERARTKGVLIAAGFDPDFVEYEAGEGECSLTGIHIDCCPCGNHP
jgi:hypothetical protein